MDNINKLCVYHMPLEASYASQLQCLVWATHKIVSDATPLNMPSGNAAKTFSWRSLRMLP